MTQNLKKKTATQVVKEVNRKNRKRFTAEEKITIVLEGLRGEDSVAGVCRKYGIHVNNYYNWSKDFIEAGKRRLSGDVLREANRDEVSELRRMNDLVKRELGELYVESKELKKTLNGLERENL